MVRPSLRTFVIVGALSGAAVVLLSVPSWAEEPRADGGHGSSRSGARNMLAGFDPRVHRLDGDVLVSDLGPDRHAVLSLDPDLQSHLEGELARYDVPEGAVVAMEPQSGRILAYVSHRRGGGGSDVVLEPRPPAASVFKVVTGAALVDAGVSPDTRVCYSGGASRLLPRDLEDRPKKDHWCATLGDAMGRSLNAIFAKLADRNLSRDTLRRYASAFGFGHALPFDVRTRPSPLDIPEERMERARAAAGFWHNHMSPLHGALIAATIANGGAMPRASVVDAVVGENRKLLYRQEPRVFRQVIPRATARAVGAMMGRTVKSGTARSWFHDPKGLPFVPGVPVAGKTGTLTGSEPYRGYNWFVGFAPADAPTLAVAALVVNEPAWRIKAAYLAREAFRHQFR